jgi:ABC-type branched-subunit amino acid transport system substrate-binding protein
MRGVIMGLVALVVSSALLPALPAYGQEPTIKIGHGGIITGPDATGTIPMFRGYEDRVRYANEQGGINGTKIDFMWKDIRGDVGRSAKFTKEFVAKGEVLQFEYCST